ncbi:MAG: hypothetical protein U5K77_03445 [Candidatus Saccharibacteria bacterium]|nr:hypothetical protein [Candidatus Saccharibacteria bacterium]
MEQSDNPKDLFDETRYAREVFSSVEDIISLPDDIEPNVPDLKELVAGEGEYIVASLASYGLEQAWVEKLDRLVHDSDRLHVIFENDALGALKTGVDAVRVRDEKVEVSVAASTLRAFISDAYHSIKPIGDNSDLCFARDAGIKMLYTYAVSLGVTSSLGINDLHAELKQDSHIRKFLTIGKDDEFSDTDTEQYAAFLPYRVASRLSIDRLESMCAKFFDADSDAAGEVVQEYAENRQRALRMLKSASYAGFSLVDLASAYPLSNDATRQFVQDMPGALRQVNRIG